MLVLDLLVAVLAGFAASESRPLLRQWFRGDWYRPMCYAIGTLLMIPFTIWTFLALGGRWDQVRYVIAGSLLGGLGVGVGVMGSRARKPERVEK